MFICVDFDGTIVDHRFPNIGQPVPGAIFYMKEWRKRGAQLILFTMRSGTSLDEAVRFLISTGVELYGINENPSQGSWTTSPKAYGKIYVDDAAFGCPLIHPPGFARPCVDWTEVGPGVLDQLV